MCVRFPDHERLIKRKRKSSPPAVNQFILRSVAAIPVSLAESNSQIRQRRQSARRSYSMGRRPTPPRSRACRRTSSRRRSPLPRRGAPAAPPRSLAPSATPPDPTPYGPASSPGTSHRSLPRSSPAPRRRPRRSCSFASPTAVSPFYSPMGSGYGRSPTMLYSPMASRYARPPSTVQVAVIIMFFD